MPIHSFWVQQLQFAQDQMFIIYFFDVITILTLLRFILEVPRMFFNRKRGIL